MLKGAAANNATRTESTLDRADHPVYAHTECGSPPARVMDDNPTRLESASTSHLSSIVRLSRSTEEARPLHGLGCGFQLFPY